MTRVQNRPHTIITHLHTFTKTIKKQQSTKNNREPNQKSSWGHCASWSMITKSSLQQELTSLMWPLQDSTACFRTTTQRSPRAVPSQQKEWAIFDCLKMKETLSWKFVAVSSTVYPSRGIVDWGLTSYKKKQRRHYPISTVFSAL